jgi:hypothetical protein
VGTAVLRICRCIATGLGAVTLMGTVTACASSGASTSRGADRSGLPPAPSVISALHSIPDTTASSSEISIVNPQALWQAAGLPAHPTAAQVMGSPRARAATIAAFDGSPAGSALWPGLARGKSARYTTPLGYPVLSIDQEITAGPQTDQVSEVFGPIKAQALVQATHIVGRRISSTGEGTILTLSSASEAANAPYPFSSVLVGTRYLAAQIQGGSVVTGSDAVPESEVIGLSNGTHISHSLANNSAVKALMGTFGPRYESIWMASGTIGSRPHLRVGVASQLRSYRIAPTMIGLAYTGGTATSQSATLAAYYPNPTAAATAAQTVGRYTRSGSHTHGQRPDRMRWRVTKIGTDGNTAFVKLVTNSPATVYDALRSKHVPLFWRP